MIRDEKLYQIIGQHLVQRRKQLDMTQDVLAEKVGVLRTSIANIEAGRQKAPLGLLFRLCTSLGIELSSILPSNKEVADNNMVSLELDGETEGVVVSVNESQVEVSDETSKMIQNLYNKIK